jgi:Prokaryotic homologs of the JAB domain
VTSDGVFLVKKSELFQSVTEARKVAGLERQSPSIELFFPKIPRCILEAVYGFFSVVCRRWDGEAIVFLYYSPQSGQFLVDVPPQRLVRFRFGAGWETEGRVEYGTLPRPEGFLKIGDAHSHGRQPAFFSSTDDHDDAEDGLRIVMGSLHRSDPDIQVSFISGNYRFALEKDDALEPFSTPVPPPAEWTRRVTCRYEGLQRARKGGNSHVNGAASG